MREKDGHLTEEELLLAADGELAPRAAEEARQHLFFCWECRTRKAEIEASIVVFVHLRNALYETRIPPADGPRRLFAARLAELASQPDRSRWWQGWHAGLLARQAALALSAIVAISLFGFAAWYFAGQYQLRRSAESLLRMPLPDRKLTPGAARAVQLEDVCVRQSSEQVRVTSIALERRVFEEYGLTGAPASNYEVDFLITPQLGGTDDIRNLWPEPYSSTVWNAHVKDQLEDRLHQLVCEQKVDLQTAQQDIATDWVAAYKKYFHTKEPVWEGGDS